MRKNTNACIKSVQKSLSLYTEWDSMKNELPISSLIKKKAKKLCYNCLIIIRHFDTD